MRILLWTSSGKDMQDRLWFFTPTVPCNLQSTDVPCTTGMDTSHMLRRRSVTYAPRFHYDPGKTCSIPDDAFKGVPKEHVPRELAAMLRATAQPAEMAGRLAGQYSGAIKRKLLDLSSLYPGS